MDIQAITVVGKFRKSPGKCHAGSYGEEAGGQVSTHDASEALSRFTSLIHWPLRMNKHVGGVNGMERSEGIAHEGAQGVDFRSQAGRGSGEVMRGAFRTTNRGD